MSAAASADERREPQRQFLAEFDAPLIEGIDVPDRPTGRRPCARRARSAGRACAASGFYRGRCSMAGCLQRPCAARAPRSLRCSRPCACSFASTSASVRPRIRASLWARQLATRDDDVARVRSRWARAASRKSTGMISVPWWKLEEGVLRIGARLAEDHRRRSACARRRLARSTDLPFDSISSCCR